MSLGFPSGKPRVLRATVLAAATEKRQLPAMTVALELVNEGGGGELRLYFSDPAVAPTPDFYRIATTARSPVLPVEANEVWILASGGNVTYQLTTFHVG